MDDATVLSIALNRTAELAAWDDETLANTLAALQADDSIDALVTGFDTTEIDRLLHDAGIGGMVVDDEAPDPPADPVTRPGDLWRLGEHRLLCGDSTKGVDVDRAMDGEKAVLMNTDPPYGVDYEGGRNPESNTPREKLHGDDSAGLYSRCLRAASLIESAPVYFWFADTKGEAVYRAVGEAGYKDRSMIVWHKLDAHYGNFMAQYMQKHEPCLYCVKDPPPWYGPTNEVTVWDVKQPTKNEFHPTQKPVELFAIPMRNHTLKGEVVYEPFAGSGSQFIAAQQLGRRCMGIEISAAYCDVVCRRYLNLTNQSPVREGDGALFSDLAPEHQDAAA